MVDIKQLIINLGKKLGFDVETEVPASESAWVDVVWYDKRFNFPKLSQSKSLLRVPKLPIVGFEIELSTGLNTKHIKGSVTNLNNLGASMGLLVLGKHNIEAMRKKTMTYKAATDAKLWKELIDKVKFAVYAEARPATRIVIMTEDELVEWAKSEGIVGI